MRPAVDVNIYASSSQDAWPLVGNHENTEIGSFIADYLDLDLEDVTKQLHSSAYFGTSDAEKFNWMGSPLGENVRTEGLDTYHGEFKRDVAGSDGDHVMVERGCGCGVH